MGCFFFLQAPERSLWMELDESLGCCDLKYLLKHISLAVSKEKGSCCQWLPQGCVLGHTDTARLCSDGEISGLSREITRSWCGGASPWIKFGFAAIHVCQTMLRFELEHVRITFRSCDYKICPIEWKVTEWACCLFYLFIYLFIWLTVSRFLPMFSLNRERCVVGFFMHRLPNGSRSGPDLRWNPYK